MQTACQLRKEMIQQYTSQRICLFRHSFSRRRRRPSGIQSNRMIIPDRRDELSFSYFSSFATATTTAIAGSTTTRLTMTTADPKTRLSNNYYNDEKKQPNKNNKNDDNTYNLLRVVEIQKYLQRRWIKLPIEYIEDPIPPDYHRRNRKRVIERDRPAMPPIESSLTDSIREAMDQAIRAALSSFSPVSSNVGTEEEIRLELRTESSKDTGSEPADDYEEYPFLPPFRFVQIIDPVIIAKIGEIVEFFLVHRFKDDENDKNAVSIEDDSFLEKVDHVRKRWVVKPAYIVVIQSTLDIMQQRKVLWKNAPCQWTEDDHWASHRNAYFNDGEPDLPYLFQEESSEEESDDDDDDFNMSEEDLDAVDENDAEEVPWYLDDNEEKLFRFDPDRYTPPPFRPFTINAQNINKDEDNELWCYCLAQAATQVLLLSLRVQGVVAEEQRTGPSFVHTKAFRDLIAVDPAERVLALIAVGQNSRHPNQRYIEVNVTPTKKSLHPFNTNIPVEGMVVDLTD